MFKKIRDIPSLKLCKVDAIIAFMTRRNTFLLNTFWSPGHPPGPPVLGPFLRVSQITSLSFSGKQSSSDRPIKITLEPFKMDYFKRYQIP